MKRADRVQMARRAAPVSLLAMAVIIAAATVGVVHGLWTETLSNNIDTAIGHTNADFIDAYTDDPPGNPDPGYGKDVATCTAQVVNEEEVVVLIHNAYPSYTCTFTTVIQNGGSLPERREPLDFDVAPELSVTEITDLTGQVLHPGEKDIEIFTVHVEKQAAQGTKYGFTIRKPFSLFVTGTIGFWRNWNSHNTYTQAEIEGWLSEIDAASNWYGPTTVNGMVKDVIQAANGQQATPETRFVAQCLATRLDERSGRLGAGDTHDVTGEDAGNYLGLATPGSATLTAIIAAIEAKEGTSPNNTEFNIMKNICDGLNNLDL